MSAWCPLVSRNMAATNTANDELFEKLIEASKQGYVEELASLLNLDKNLYRNILLQSDSNGFTALHHAKNSKVAKILVDYVESGGLKQFVTRRNVEERTVLHLASQKGQVDIIEYLSGLAVSELFTLQDDTGRTALHYAKNKDVAQVLVQSIKPDQQREFLLISGEFYKQTAFHEAAEDGRNDVVEYLLSLAVFKGNELLWKEDALGRTALHCASNEGIARLLVESIDVAKRQEYLLKIDKYKATALHIAASERGRASVVDYLCNTIKPNDELILKKDSCQCTALHYAASKETAEILINSISSHERRDFILMRDIAKCSVLYKAAGEGRYGVAKYLLDITLPDNALLLLKDEYGSTALHYAPSVEIAELLLESVEADKRREVLLIRDKLGKTVVHRTAEDSATEVVKYFVSYHYQHHGDDGLQKGEGSKSISGVELLLLKDGGGRTALHYSSNEEITHTLIEAADNRLDFIMAEDDEGNTAVMHAIKRRKVDAVVCMLEYLDTNCDESDIRFILEKKNILSQNLFHLASISPIVDEIFEALEDYVFIIDINSVIVPDLYNNTPLSYIAARYSTKVFAEFLMKMPLAKRQRYIKEKNKSGTDCYSIASKRQSSEKFYLESVLCDEKAVEEGYLRTFLVLTPDNTPRQDVLRHMRFNARYKEEMLRVLKYSLNEYSLLDSAYIISHKLLATHFVQVAALILEDGKNISTSLTVSQNSSSSLDLDADLSCRPTEPSTSSLWFYIDLDDLTKQESETLQTKVNTIDKPENHGKPKILVVSRCETDSGANLTIPGPDFMIANVVYNKPADKRTTKPLDKSCVDIDLLLSGLQEDKAVKCVEVNSTLGRRYERDGVRPQSSGHVTWGDQILINGDERGKALIICNRHEREEWDQEFKQANRIFGKQLGLEVMVRFDQTADGIIDTILEFSKSPGHGPLVALAIMAHGLDRNIAGNDCVSTCSVQKVVDSLCVDQLENVPKLLLLSFCRGGIGQPRRNRINESWECTVLPSLAAVSTQVRTGLSEAEKVSEWAKAPFPNLELTENCYVCYSTLPDSKSRRGQMMSVFSKHLTDVYDYGCYYDALQPLAEREIATTVLQTPDSSENSVHPSSGVEVIEPIGTTEALTLLTSDTPKGCILPRVELITLLTDVSGLVREESQFTQYMNHCYKLTNKSKTILIDILPSD